MSLLPSADDILTVNGSCFNSATRSFVHFGGGGLIMIMDDDEIENG